ncbi:MAG: membrane dipeptidase, partial [Lachnospiraceae bacterium]|nr:membrane dipeptidase [Lachnospiraceae bacterium]
MNEDILIQREYLEKAMELHRRYPVADAHLDLAGEVLLRSKLGEKEIINNRYLDNWKKAGLNLVMSSVYVPSVVLAEKGTEGAWEDARAQIEALKREAAYLSEICMIKNKEDLEQAIREEKIGILLYMEGLDCIGGKVERLEELYQRGVRGASLTWSRQNMLATGCCKAGEYRQISGGLTSFGKRVVQELERQQMFIDVSHLNDDGFADVAGLTEKPFLATHSCARAVYDNYRNLTEEQIDTIAKKGGVIGLNGCKLIAGSLSGNHLEMLCK